MQRMNDWLLQYSLKPTSIFNYRAPFAGALETQMFLGCPGYTMDSDMCATEVIEFISSFFIFSATTLSHVIITFILCDYIILLTLRLVQVSYLQSILYLYHYRLIFLNPDSNNNKKSNSKVHQIKCEFFSGTCSSTKLSACTNSNPLLEMCTQAKLSSLIQEHSLCFYFLMALLRPFTPHRCSGQKSNPTLSAVLNKMYFYQAWLY